MNLVRQEDHMQTATPDVKGSVSLAFVVRSIRSNKLVIVAWLVLAIACSILFLHVVTKRYEANLVFGSQQGKGSFLYRSDQPTLISLANTDPEVDRFSAVLQSMSLAYQLSRRDDIMHRIFASDWDTSSGQWREPEGILPALKRAVSYTLGQTGWQAPDYVSLYNYIQSEVNVLPGTIDNTYIIRYRDKDPVFAAQFVDALFRTADNIVVESDSTRIDRVRKFLEDMTQQTISIEMKSNIFSLLNRYLAFDAFAKVGGPYSVDIVDNAYPNSRASSPRPLWTLIGGIFLGLFIGLLHAMRRSAARNKVEEQ